MKVLLRLVIGNKRCLPNEIMSTQYLKQLKITSNICVTTVTDKRDKKEELHANTNLLQISLEKPCKQ